MNAYRVINIAITVSFLAFGTVAAVEMIKALLSHEWGQSALGFLILVACVYLAVLENE